MTSQVQTSALNVVPTPRSGTIAAGGTAQDLMPARTAADAGGIRHRLGYLLQNQSNGPLYIRSKGAAGALSATTDQNSVMIPAGGVWEPSNVSDFAYSIIGATTGQAFHCLEW